MQLHSWPQHCHVLTRLDYSSSGLKSLCEQAALSLQQICGRRATAAALRFVDMMRSSAPGLPFTLSVALATTRRVSRSSPRKPTREILQTELPWRNDLHLAFEVATRPPKPAWPQARSRRSRSRPRGFKTSAKELRKSDPIPSTLRTVLSGMMMSFCYQM